MRRTYLHACTALLALAVAGCADNNASVAMTSMCAPTDNCTFKGSCDGVWMGGHLAIDYGTTTANQTRYLEWPIEVQNQLAPNTDDESGQLDTHGAYLQWSENEYVIPGASVPTVTSAMQQFVPSSSTAVALIEVIPPPGVPGADPSLDALHAALAVATSGTEIQVRIKLHGSYADSHGFTSGELTVPVTVLHDGSAMDPLNACAAGQTVGSICPPNAGQSVTVTCK